MASIHITDIESAINHWRGVSPSTDGFTLGTELHALAAVYADMALHRCHEIDESKLPPEALQAWLVWYHSTPDTPCIAICSTSQGDEVCKGCGRSFAEVQHWTAMTPVEKRATWRRITAQASAWRFTKYAERAAEGLGAATQPGQLR